MSATVRAALISLCLLVIGIAAVNFEVQNRRHGARILELLRDRDGHLERLRRLEMRYNRLISPDVLEKRLEEDFGPTGDTAEAAGKDRSEEV